MGILDKHPRHQRALYMCSREFAHAANHALAPKCQPSLAPSSSQIFSLLRPAEKPKRIRVCLY